MPDQRLDQRLDQRPDERLDQRAVTPRRRAANQAAALRSTGPTSPEGKQRAAFNSFKHGAYAEQENVRAQFFSHSDRDPAELTDLRARLLSDWQPASAQQALLVGDLAWLYWLRDEAARALIDRQARERAYDELARDERRFMDRHRAAELERSDYFHEGCLNLPGSNEKFIAAARLLDQLDGWAARAAWAPGDEDLNDTQDEEDTDDIDDIEDDNDGDGDGDDDKDEADDEDREHLERVARIQAFMRRGASERPSQEDVRRDLWGGSPSARGVRVRELWRACARDHAPASDPRARQIRALLEEERAALAEEQALFRRRQALDLDEPARDPNGEKGVRALGETWRIAVGAVERLDRQINAKVRLLMRLRTMDCSGDVSSPAVADKPGDSVAPASCRHPDNAVGTAALQKPGGADAAATETGIAGTKPSKPLESTKPADEPRETGAEPTHPAGPVGDSR